MPKKKFVLHIDEATMAADEKWAADDFRSVNGLLEWIITRSLQQAGRKKPMTSEQEDLKKPQQDDL